MDMGKEIRRQRIVWGIVGLVVLTALFFAVWEYFATRLPSEYTVLRGVLVEDVNVDKETGTATMTLSGGGGTGEIRFRTGVRAYHWDETPMDLAELTAGKEIEVFVDPYDTAAPPSVHDGCYRIIVCDGPDPSAVLV